jgi:hypothetical protein
MLPSYPYFLAYSWSLKMEAVYSSEMTATLYQTTQYHIPGDSFFIVTAARNSDFITSVRLSPLQAEFRDCDHWNTN